VVRWHLVDVMRFFKGGILWKNEMWLSFSEYLALEKVKRGEMFEGAKNGKYADEYLVMLS